jgi:2-polyprenyl-6-hydroxyphenyl methylase/3-demethylubiquinone-9 3-methyltransferase
MLRAWRGEVVPPLPGRPRTAGFHDEALFAPTSPPGHWAFSRLRLLVTLDAVRSLPGLDVLDVAAGPCIMAAALHAAGRRVTVNDLRPLDDALGTWGLEGAVRRQQGDVFAHTPDRIGRFDVVLCAELVEHVAHPDRLLGHLRAFLRPGGHLVLTTPNGRFVASRLPTFSQIEDPAALEGSQFRPDAEGHLFLMTPEELAGTARKAGFEVVSLACFGTPAITGHLKLRLLKPLAPPSLWYLLERIGWSAPRPVRRRWGSHLLLIARAP